MSVSTPDLAGQPTEAQTLAEIERLARELYAAARPIWVYGDGGGGLVQDVLDEARKREGLLTAREQDAEWRRQQPKPDTCPVCGGGRPSFRRANRQANAERHQTYVMQRGWWVKIGRALDVDARLRELQRHPQSVRLPKRMDPGASLTLLHSWRGDDEHTLHRRYAGLHVAGEWFEATPDLLADVQRWASERA